MGTRWQRRSPCDVWASSELRLQQLALEAEGCRHRRIEFVEELALRLHLRLPLVAIDRHRRRKTLGRHVETGDVEVAVTRHATDQRLSRAGFTVRARQHPLQHPHVLAVSRPEELAVAVLAKPVDEENGRWILQAV